MSVPPTPFGFVTKMFDEWINLHPASCKDWNKLWKLNTKKDDKYLPPKFTFTFYIDDINDDWNYTQLDIKNCPFCGAGLIHWIEKQQRTKVIKQ